MVFFRSKVPPHNRHRSLFCHRCHVLLHLAQQCQFTNFHKFPSFLLIIFNAQHAVLHFRVPILCNYKVVPLKQYSAVQHSIALRS